jgi:pSer/pThr/pTyr-binding forkhead associated (FHA) protein
MSDGRFHSVHLEGQPRRDLFRQARSQLSASLGQQTITGAIPEFVGDTPAKPKLPAISNTVYSLKDGTTLHRLIIGINSVGRLPDNQVVLADDHVSRRHCAVVVHSDGRCELHDIASKNGTLLNGKRISGPTVMTAGDQITLCGKMLELVQEKGSG